MIKLGVTGGIASGKSTACTYFKKLGAAVFDADKVAQKILFNDKEVQQQIQETLDINFEDGIDTKKIARVAFSSRQKQQQLNDIIHPKVTEKFSDKVDYLQKQDIDLLVADVALLFESGFERELDYTLLVYTDKNKRIKRALKRGSLSKEQIQKRMALQMDTEEKKRRADFVIENNGPKQELKENVHDIYSSLID